MIAAVAAAPVHPAVAVLLGLGAVVVAGLVVAMAWSVHVRQIRLAEQLSRRQFTVTAEAAALDGDQRVILEEAAAGAGHSNGHGHANGNGNGKQPPVIIEGPETVVTGEQARYRIRAASQPSVVSWAVGGGSVSQSPDPSHPNELLVIADRPGDLTVIARAREGMMERRATKSVTAVPEVTAPAPPVTLRLFLHSWGLVTVALLVIGFAAALAALGTLSAADFVALVVPLAAVLGMAAVNATRDGDSPRTPPRATPAARSDYRV